MGIFSTDNKQLTLIYNSNTSIGKQTYAYITESKKKVRSIDTAKTKVTATQWVEIADELNVEIKKLVNRKHPDFTEIYADDIHLNDHDWLKVLETHPHLVQFSILIQNTEFHLLHTPADFLKFMAPDSAGVPKNPEK
ncbi:arsenate reductase family protein [Aquimarina spongiae]|uniref:Arsenate reductase, glutaredoxin family n=1 Tax=Aquimarina spongiae TaxID=570521 RepID=A0A1M6GL55_9FLAO|nr:hypothetical protein [Aquimarina spongiae]SHJ10674.1 Arsenate reductase, glutaredoxin family [Aquimarina spongiae]